MTAIDPVCGMDVDTETAEWKSDYEGQPYYFCSPGCKRSFDKEPGKYAAGQGQTGLDHSHSGPGPH